MDEKRLLEIRVKLEALVSEREGMIATNKFREAGGWALAYDDVSFIQNAEQMRALLNEPGPVGNPK